MVEPLYSSRNTAVAMGATGSEPAFDVFVKNIASASNEQRLALAQQLKDARLWTGKISSKFNIKYFTVLRKLEEEYEGQVAVNKIAGVTTPAKRFDVLADLIAGQDGEGSGGPTKQTYVTSASQTAKLLNTVAVDLLERNLTKAEQAKYLKIINDAQRKQPSVQTQSNGSSVTMGGVDEQQLITEKLQATPEAQKVRATDAYTVLMQELGGLR
jgi:hypothetical protein